ncbi:hypothetical protein WJX77_010863 [Trebouxia sp. C0004]
MQLQCSSQQRRCCSKQDPGTFILLGWLVVNLKKLSATCATPTQGPQAEQRLPRDIGVLHKVLLFGFKDFPVNLCKEQVTAAL